MMAFAIAGIIGKCIKIEVMTLDGIFKGEQRVVLFTIWPRNLLNLDIKGHLTFKEHLSICSYRH